jgi:hypothetical protein
MKNETTTQAAEVEVIKSPREVETQLVIGEGNTVQFIKGAKVSPDELAGWVANRANNASSSSIQAVNGARLARKLPAVGKQSAFDYVLAKVRSECATESTYQNILALLPCADLVENSGLACSPFAVKEAIGFLKKKEAIAETANGFKMLSAKAGAVGIALKKGTGVNAMREVVGKAKDNNPTLFPKKTGSTSKKTETVKADDSADKLATDLKIIVSRWDKLASAKDGVKTLRNACGKTVADLAKLAGFEMVAVK